MNCAVKRSSKARRQTRVSLRGLFRRAFQSPLVWLTCAGIGAAMPVAADIASAVYKDPTTRYAHGILGDAVEWGSLEIRLTGGKRLKLTLPESRVFEDLEPRLADVDLDGDLEVVVIESSQTAGARLSIYDEDGLVAATPHIGSRNRWLAPIGIGDLDGDGLVELSYIDRPHLAKILRVWTFDGGNLSEVANKSGLTNHRIGEDFISGGLRDCGDGPEMITADARWQTIVSTRFDGQSLTSQELGRFDRKALQQVMSCQ